MFGPEAEFFIFDDVRFTADPYNTGFKLDGAELPSNTRHRIRDGQPGHRPRTKGGYFPVPPIDSAQDIRSEMLSVMAEMGVVVEKHHHEVASAQHELGIKFGPMVTLADHMQIYKYVIHNVAQAYGKTAMLHAQARLRRQRLGHALPPVDLEGLDAGVRRQQVRRPVRHLPATTSAASSSTPRRINAFTNPTTNSYKRLVPGYEAPVLLAYSARNRSASCRIPRRVEPEGQAHRDPLPRSGGQPLPRRSPPC